MFGCLYMQPSRIICYTSKILMEESIKKKLEPTAAVRSILLGSSAATSDPMVQEPQELIHKMVDLDSLPAHPTPTFSTSAEAPCSPPSWPASFKKPTTVAFPELTYFDTTDVLRSVRWSLYSSSGSSLVSDCDASLILRRTYQSL
jgi:hypothetical protein